jgi:hypothetical protein
LLIVEQEHSLLHDPDSPMRLEMVKAEFSKIFYLVLAFHAAALQAREGLGGEPKNWKT